MGAMSITCPAFPPAKATGISEALIFITLQATPNLNTAQMWFWVFLYQLRLLAPNPAKRGSRHTLPSASAPKYVNSTVRLEKRPQTKIAGH
jgi:hypothetical protein